MPSSCRRRGPPTRSPVPLPRSRCECDTPPREGRPAGRPRLRWGRPFPSPAFGPSAFSPQWWQSFLPGGGRSSILHSVTVGGRRTFFLQMSASPTSKPSFSFPVPEIPVFPLWRTGLVLTLRNLAWGFNLLRALCRAELWRRGPSRIATSSLGQSGSAAL